MFVGNISRINVMHRCYHNLDGHFFPPTQKVFVKNIHDTAEKNITLFNCFSHCNLFHFIILYSFPDNQAKILFTISTSLIKCIKLQSFIRIFCSVCTNKSYLNVTVTSSYL